MSLNNLARQLYDRFTHLRQSKDKEEVSSLYTRLVHVPRIVSFADLSAVAARAWICTAQHFQHPTLLPAYETSPRLHC